jgi:EAL and modified HD-GYP domain-containing signal transduction protein
MSTACALAPPPASTDVVVARQPIFDQHARVIGYELLYRSHGLDRAVFCDGEHATASVVTASFMDIGIARMVEGHPAFINVTREFVVSGAAYALPAEQVVLEILEDVEVDGVLVDAVAALVRAGYRIALDDFTFDARWHPLLQLAHIVKIDVMAMSLEQVREQVAKLAPYQVELLAEKVESEAEFHALREIGFVWYQGFFFARPVIVTGTRLPSNRLAVLKLLAVLNDPETDVTQVTALVVQDPALSYRLMRFINCAAIALPQRVTSIHRAVVYMGLSVVKRWVTLMVLASMEDKPSELTRLALVRARMVEQICVHTRGCDPSAGFTVGLFSLLDAFMDRPLPELLAELPLSRDVLAALLRGEGAAGAALRGALCWERAEWGALPDRLPDIAPETLSRIYRDAVQWAGAAAATAG